MWAINLPPQFQSSLRITRTSQVDSKWSRMCLQPSVLRIWIERFLCFKQAAISSPPFMDLRFLWTQITDMEAISLLIASSSSKLVKSHKCNLPLALNIAQHQLQTKELKTRVKSSKRFTSWNRSTMSLPVTVTKARRTLSPTLTSTPTSPKLNLPTTPQLIKFPNSSTSIVLISQIILTSVTIQLPLL